MRKNWMPIQRNRPGRVSVTCSQCGEKFESIKSQMTRRGGAFKNKFCRRECWMQWRTERKQSRLAKLLKQQYGMTEEDYQSLLDAQVGVCGICRCSPDEAGQGRLVVDHDHATGRVRGLLCRSCNVGLGHFKDDPILLRSAFRYLDRPSDT